MSDAARDQGWCRPEDLDRLRSELGDTDTPVDDETGLAQVRETRRLLEQARKGNDRRLDRWGLPT